MVWESRILKTRRLTHEKRLRKGTLKKCVLDVKLTDRPRTSNGNGEDRSNGSGLHDWAKCIIKVLSSLADESPSLRAL